MVYQLDRGEKGEINTLWRIGRRGGSWIYGRGYPGFRWTILY